MSMPCARRPIASVLSVVLLWPAGLALAGSPSTATLTGTVFADDVKTPLAGATVVVTDPTGRVLSSAPTTATGAFKVDAIPPGSCRVTLTTADGTFPIATPVHLAPGQIRGVQVALKGKAKSDDKKKKDKGAGYYDDGKGGLGAMIAVLIGFVAAGAEAVHKGNETTSTSPSSPGD